MIRVALVSALLALTGIPANAAELPIDKKTVEESSHSSHITIHLSRRVEMEELQAASAKMFKDAGNPRSFMIVFYVPEPDPNSVWATSRLDQPTDKQLTTVINNFTVREWESFGKEKRMYPVDGRLVGLWTFPLTGSGGVDISIYSWNGVEYLYTRYKEDNSGSPVRVKSVSNLNGRKITEPFDINDYWLLRKDGTLERYEGGRLVTGWQGKKLSSEADLVARREPTRCSVIRSSESMEVNLDRYGAVRNARIIRVSLLSDVEDETSAVGLAKDIVNQFEGRDVQAIEMEFFNPIVGGSFAERSSDFFVVYTSNPSRLASRDAAWSTREHPNATALEAATAARHLCTVTAKSAKPSPPSSPSVRSPAQ